MRIDFHGSWRDILLIVVSVLIFLMLLILPAAYALAEEPNDALIRFHVVAHSDSLQDQRIKLQVRNAVWNAFGERLTQAGHEGFEALNETLQQCLNEIERLAQQTARLFGFTGEVHAEAGLMDLPAKVYQNDILPAGRYYALRITLGSGNGQNWWCVLYPELCLSLSQASVPDPVHLFRWNAKDIFKHWLMFGK